MAGGVEAETWWAESERRTEVMRRFVYAVDRLVDNEWGGPLMNSPGPAPMAAFNAARAEVARVFGWAIPKEASDVEGK